MDIEAGMRVRIKTYEELAEMYDVNDDCIVINLPDGGHGYFNRDMRKFSGNVYEVTGINPEDGEIWFEDNEDDGLNDFYWFVWFVEPVDDSYNEATDLDEDTITFLVQKFLLV